MKFKELIEKLEQKGSHLLPSHLQNYWKNWFPMKKNGFG